MKRISFALSLMIMFVVSSGDHLFASNKIRVVATTSTLGSMARELLGNDADIYSVAPPKQNIHFIQPTPRDVLKVKKAEILIHGGLDLEAWRGPLLDAAGNALFLGDAKNSIDASKAIPLLEIPQSLSRIGGDIHAFGNPHYSTDPENAKMMMNTIAMGLGEIIPERQDEFLKKAAEWNQKLDQAMVGWSKRLQFLKGASIVTYHKSWPYFANRFNLRILGELEPKPGIPPTPKHLAELIEIMKAHKTKLIIQEGYNEERTAQKISKETGARIAVLAQNVGENTDCDDYISMMEHNVQMIEKSLQSKEN